MLESGLSPGADDAFWSVAVPLRVGETTSLALGPADQLLHTLAHGLKWSRISSYRWVADAVTLVRSVPGQLDWDRLVGEALRRRVAQPCRDGLRYLERFGVFVPPAVVDRLGRARVTWVECKADRARRRPPQRRGLFEALAVHALTHRNLVEAGAAPPGLRGLLGVVQSNWRAPSVASLPAAAARRGWQRLWMSSRS